MRRNDEEAKEEKKRKSSVNVIIMGPTEQNRDSMMMKISFKFQ